MTILSAQSIRQRHLNMLYADSRPMIEPFCERATFNGMSYGLSSCGYDMRLDQMVQLHHGVMVLASTQERVRIPTNLVGYVKDKSSWARQGLTVANTVLEPGWYGYITLELTWHGNPAVPAPTLYPGTPIVQVQFEMLDAPTDQPYAGKYQDQERGPVPAKYEP
jgi:dCTP deaminase